MAGSSPKHAARRCTPRLALALLLSVASCGVGPKGVNGFWRATPADNGGRTLGLAIGRDGDRQVWTADGWVFHFAQASTRAHCHLFWTRQGGHVAYVGQAQSLEADAYVASADVSGSDAGIATLSWEMSPLFADEAAKQWRAAHPSADSNLAIHTRVQVAAILYDADTLDLHGDVVATDAATGAVLAEEYPDWRLRRQDHCMLSPEF